VPTERIPYQPTPAAIDALLQAAARHPLGVDYLVHGHLGTVAITFGCHAFTVVAARERLAADASARRAS
jgi:hypothetical protein